MPNCWTGYSDGGVFRLDGVLVGTHAFLVLGNILGVPWDGGSIRTQDIDIALAPSQNNNLTKNRPPDKKKRRNL